MQLDQSQPHRKAAFFDVDNTLLNLKSMFSFQSYYLDNWRAARGATPSYEGFLQNLKCHADQSDRLAMNRMFYQSYAGHRQADIRVAARVWFDALITAEGDDLWIQSTLTLARRLQLAGFLLIAVSGSSHDILAPLIDRLEFDHCLATHLEVHDGVMTGEIAGLQMIGHGKREAILRFARELDIDLASSVACGDHITDLPMLEATGKAFVVAGDAQLETIAHSRGWKVLQTQQSPADMNLAHT